MTGRAEILEAAREAVMVDRAATHGAVEDSFATIATMWSALTGAEITPAQVALMLAALKVVRAFGNPTHSDNWVDIAGYGACGGELAARAAGVAPAWSGVSTGVSASKELLVPEPVWMASVRGNL